MSRYAVGIGARSGVRADAVRALLDRVLAEHGLDPSGAAFATVAARADEPGIREALRALAGDDAGPGVAGVRDAAGGLLAWPPHELAGEPVPNPSGRVAGAAGTPSVAEASALRTARTLPGATGAELVVPKTVGDGVTVAVARPVPARSADGPG